MISFKSNVANLRAEIIAEVIRQDDLARQYSEQLLIEGKNVAHKLVLKDTTDLDKSIETGSSVTRKKPCVYDIVLGNQMEYGEYQEFGPKETTKKKWKFRPHIRPAYAIMRVKEQEVFDRVYGQD